MDKERSRFVGGLAAVLFFGYFAFIRGTQVPIFSLADLGFHELGHMLTYPFPDLITAAMGSIFQIAIPWGLAAYFMLFRRDPLGGSFCLAWAGSSAQNVSVYIADAPFQTLQLIGGDHDWAYILGPEQFDALHKAAAVATVTKMIGAVMLAVAAIMCITGLFLSYRPMHAHVGA